MLSDNGFVDIFTPVLCLEDVSPLPPPEPRGPRSTKFIIPWPLHLSASSASLQASVPFPLSGYRNGLSHSRVILTDPQTFPAFSAHLSRIAAFSPPGASLCALPSSFHKNYSHLLAPYGGLATPTMGLFRRLLPSLSLRPSWLLASLQEGFYFQAFSHQVTLNDCRI